jgi:hypothetical protein
MKWMTSVFVLFLAASCMGQQMDEKNDPALQLTFYTPHRNSLVKERQSNDLLDTVWIVGPYIVERYDHTNKWMGIVVELRGNRQVLRTGAGGLMFTIDGKQVAVSPAILAHSKRTQSSKGARWTASWNIGPKTPAEEAAMVQFVNAVASGHEVYATLFPGDGGGDRFTAKLTDEQLLGFHDAQQYYESLALVKKVAQPVTQ